MKELIKNRVEQLRAEMRKAQLDAYLIYGTDPHLSEYLPEHWQTRSFISGFTGSAGMVIVTAQKAALWTDSRYFLQAEIELEGSGIELVKMRTEGHPDPAKWLKQNLNPGDIAGTDAWCISVSQFSGMKQQLHESGIVLTEAGDLLANIWNDRPPLPDAPVYEHPLDFACISRTDKIRSVIQELEKSGANAQVITALDDIAWTFNLRGSDVQCNPVFLAYAVVSKHEAALFVNPAKVSENIRKRLLADGIQLFDYPRFPEYLRNLPHETSVLIDPDRTSQAVMESIAPHCPIVTGLSVPCKLKALKSEAELSHIRQAMKKDGVALVEFLYWLKNNLGKTTVSEFTIAERLTEFRKKQADFIGISFPPIVGYKEHGAIVHFQVTPENALSVEADGFLLFDSGGQYLDGTTDVTRTIALSELNERQKKDFTLVLKGMIALTTAKFPVQTRGYHLDILARKDLWKHGMNYGHGTGHGVGYFLNVHEGPMSIRQEFNDRVIEAGMVVSNEPAFYRQGEYGLRTENMIVCRKAESTEFGDFLEFDTLTLCPIDVNAIESTLLTPDEIFWINEYHRRVYDELAPLLDEHLTKFLGELTQPIS